MKEQKNEATNIPSTNDTTPKVTGIGGIFFFSDNLKETKEWYAKNLGLEINEWGSSSFESRRAKIFAQWGRERSTWTGDNGPCGFGDGNCAERKRYLTGFRYRPQCRPLAIFMVIVGRPN